jgi:hypothetical protein
MTNEQKAARKGYFIGKAIAAKQAEAQAAKGPKAQ